LLTDRQIVGMCFVVVTPELRKWRNDLTTRWVRGLLSTFVTMAHIMPMRGVIKLSKCGSSNCPCSWYFSMYTDTATTPNFFLQCSVNHRPKTQNPKPKMWQRNPEKQKRKRDTARDTDRKTCGNYLQWPQLSWKSRALLLLLTRQ
jgi:hypothetical protein